MEQSDVQVLQYELKYSQEILFSVYDRLLIASGTFSEVSGYMEHSELQGRRYRTFDVGGETQVYSDIKTCVTRRLCAYRDTEIFPLLFKKRRRITYTDPESKRGGGDLEASSHVKRYTRKHTGFTFHIKCCKIIMQQRNAPIGKQCEKTKGLTRKIDALLHERVGQKKSPANLLCASDAIMCAIWAEVEFDDQKPESKVLADAYSKFLPELANLLQLVTLPTYTVALNHARVFTAVDYRTSRPQPRTAANLIALKYVSFRRPTDIRGKAFISPNPGNDGLSSLYVQMDNGDCLRIKLGQKFPILTRGAVLLCEIELSETNQISIVDLLACVKIDYNNQTNYGLDYGQSYPISILVAMSVLQKSHRLNMDGCDESSGERYTLSVCGFVRVTNIKALMSDAQRLVGVTKSYQSIMFDAGVVEKPVVLMRRE